MAEWWVRWWLCFLANGGHHNIFLPAMSANEASAVVGTSLWQAEGQDVAWESFCPQNIIYFLRQIDDVLLALALRWLTQVKS